MCGIERAPGSRHRSLGWRRGWGQIAGAFCRGGGVERAFDECVFDCFGV